MTSGWLILITPVPLLPCLPSMMKEALANLASKADYIENQSRRNNIVIDGIPDVPTESWDESQRKAKKLFADHLKMGKLNELTERGSTQPMGSQGQ